MKTMRKASEKNLANKIVGGAFRRGRKPQRKTSQPRQSGAGTAKDAMLHNWLMEKDGA